MFLVDTNIPLWYTCCTNGNEFYYLYYVSYLTTLILCGCFVISTYLLFGVVYCQEVPKVENYLEQRITIFIKKLRLQKVI